MRAVETKTKTWQYGDTESAWGLGQRNTEGYSESHLAKESRNAHCHTRFSQVLKRYKLMKQDFPLGLKTKDKFNTSHLSTRICVLG